MPIPTATEHEPQPQPPITWREVVPKVWIGSHHPTATYPTYMMIVMGLFGTYTWSVTNGHRPDKQGNKSTLEAAKLAAETYELRGVTLNANEI